MLVRLLIAVLMLMGPMPVRLCTCAAARPSAPADQSRLSGGLPTPDAKGCGCRTKSNAASGLDADEASCRQQPSARDAGGGHSQPDKPQHDRNCPAVNPAPVVVAAVPSPAADVPAGDDFSLPLWVELDGGENARVVCQTERHQVFRSVPLYISLLTLRN